MVVRGGKIAEVGPAQELKARWDEDGRRYAGCVLMPGLVNSHSHLEYSAFRGLSGPCGFGEWMLRLLLARRKLTAEDYLVSARWGARECARAGMTYLADTSFEGWTSARAAGEAGLRARVHLEVIGLDDAELPHVMGRVETRLAVLQEACSHLVEPGLSPHAPYTVSRRLYRELARYGRRNNLRVATHVAESKAEVELLRRGTGAIAQAYKAAQLWKGQRWIPPGLSPVAYLDACKALGPETLAVHCVELDEADVKVIASTGAAVAHCPRSNAHLECGMAPVARLRSSGVLTGLGTDSLASNDSLDLFEEMRAAIKVSRARAAAALAGGAGAAPPVLDEQAVLRMATLEGAAAVGLADRLGSLEPGKEADVVAVRLVSASQTPEGHSPQVDDPIIALVSRATAADVVMTMVAGRIVYERASAPIGPDELDIAFASVRRRLHGRTDDQRIAL